MLGRISILTESDADEIINRLPEEPFKSNSATFVDPACGGGQLLLAVARRLRKFGHTRDNIISRLFGFETHQLYVNYVLNATPLKGSVIKVKSYKEISQVKQLAETNMPKKFDVEVMNPPYDKIGKTPLYYDFVRSIKHLLADTGHAAIIIPTGWLVGSKKAAVDFRNFVFKNFNISRMTYSDCFIGDRGSSEKTGKTTNQPTIIVELSLGTTEEFIFERKLGNKKFSTKIAINNFGLNRGIPLAYGDQGQQIAILAEDFSTKYQMTSRRPAPDEWCIHVSGANRTGLTSTSLTPSVYFQKLQNPFAVSCGPTEGSRLYHILGRGVENKHRAENLKLWLESKCANLIFSQWATTHRNIGSNLGHVPAIIVEGKYDNRKALEHLGLSNELISWIDKL